MDRVISLLAALVGLIALGGAILVHVNGDNQRREMAVEIAQLRVSIGLSSEQPPGQPVAVAAAEPTPHVPSAEHLPSAEPVSAEAPASSADPAVAAAAGPDTTAAELKTLQDKIAQLEQANEAQASQLAEAQAKLAAQSSASSEEPATSVAATDPVVAPTPAPAPPSEASTGPVAASSVITADGPTKDCIPLGTRFMGAAGDSFPICKTKMVLKVAAVSEGVATVTGAGDVAVGATVPYDKACSVAVFSADTSGYAEMRVTCN
jgi:hypothetical protein